MNCAPKPIGCGREVTGDELLGWDKLSQNEFWISGLCLDPCQNIVFAEPEEEWPDDYDWNDEAPF